MVGWQGVEQMQSRYTAISATAESLGPAYGKTLGSYLGTGSALQNYQNLATGGVYELAGTVKAIAIVLVCLLVPSAILAITIRPEPLQKRPPPRT